SNGTGVGRCDIGAPDDVAGDGDARSAGVGAADRNAQCRRSTDPTPGHRGPFSPPCLRSTGSSWAACTTRPGLIRTHGDHPGLQLQLTPAGARLILGTPAGPLV